MRALLRYGCWCSTDHKYSYSSPCWYNTRSSINNIISQSQLGYGVYIMPTLSKKKE